MAKVKSYTSTICPCCMLAIRLLQSKNIAFKHIDVSMSRASRQSMRGRANGRKSAPKIFVHDEHMGGCDDVMALERVGHLDALLNRQTL